MTDEDNSIGIVIGADKVETDIVGAIIGNAVLVVKAAETITNSDDVTLLRAQPEPRVEHLSRLRVEELPVSLEDILSRL